MWKVRLCYYIYVQLRDGIRLHKTQSRYRIVCKAVHTTFCNLQHLRWADANQEAKITKFCQLQTWVSERWSWGTWRKALSRRSLHSQLTAHARTHARSALTLQHRLLTQPAPCYLAEIELRHAAPKIPNKPNRFEGGSSEMCQFV